MITKNEKQTSSTPPSVSLKSLCLSAVA